ncbi:MAG: hypothetical protein RRA94_04015 [Bacteroidota bacterium]|nr:hypothetical protein [Bacteroidota bacterium]
MKTVFNISGRSLAVVLMILSAVELFSVQNAVPTPSHPAGPDSNDVADSALSTLEREKTVSDVPLTPYEMDSLLKHLNFFVRYIGDTTGRHVNRDVVTRLLESSHYRARDSAFVLEGDGCIRIELRLGTLPLDPDTIVWRDICREACFDSVSIPLGCWLETTQTRTDTQTVQICDTVCVQNVTANERLYYHLWQSAGYTQLALFAGCHPVPQSATDFKLVLKDGRWYQPLDTTKWHHLYPADDSCYVDMFTWSYFVSMAQSPYSPWAGLGPWLVDSSEVVTRQVEVDCGLRGTTGISRVVSNCRDTVRTVQITETVMEWQDAGRDTTIWDNRCDCLIPVFRCQEIPEVTRRVKYIYDRTYDTLRAPCRRQYVIPVYEYYESLPRPFWQVCRSELDTAHARLESLLFASGERSRSTATQVHIRAVVGGIADTCWVWSCATNENIDPVGPDDWWIERDAIDAFFPCPDYECVADQIGSYTVTDVCCAKDTVETYYCTSDAGALYDSVQVTYTIPDRTQPCSDSTVVGIIPIDSVIVDSLVWYETTGLSTEYLLVHEDTCCYDPSLNGLEFPCELWIVRDCDPQPYWGTDGRLHIPCDTDVDRDGDGLYDQTDYAFITNNDRWLTHRIDSLTRRASMLETENQSLHDSLAVLRADFDSLNIGDIDTTGYVYNVESGRPALGMQAIPNSLDIRGSLAVRKVTTGAEADSLLVVSEGVVKKIPPMQITSWSVSQQNGDFTAECNTIHLIDASGADVLVSLPVGGSSGCELVLKRIDDGSGMHTITIDGTVDDTPEPTLGSFESIRLITDGNQWYFISAYTP